MSEGKRRRNFIFIWIDLQIQYEFQFLPFRFALRHCFDRPDYFRFPFSDSPVLEHLSSIGRNTLLYPFSDSDVFGERGTAQPGDSCIFLAFESLKLAATQ